MTFAPRRSSWPRRRRSPWRARVALWSSATARTPTSDACRTPENDAVDLSAALRRRLGFEVTTELGHGLEMDGINCLVPVDAHLKRDVDVRYETVTLDDLLA